MVVDVTHASSLLRFPPGNAARSYVQTSPGSRGIGEDRDRFLSEAGRLLGDSLDYEHTLKTVARLAVPEVADWCSIDLVQHNGTLIQVATRHRDPAREQLVAALHHKPLEPDALSGSPLVVRSGRTEYVPMVSESLLMEREDDQERRSILQDLRLRSSICAPLISRKRVIGALALYTAMGRDLTPVDVRTAEDLARSAAVAIDNARLYDDALRAVRAREDILSIVAHDLRTPLSVVTTAASLLTSLDAVHPDGDRIRQRGEAIQRATQHMLRLVTDLTAFAQIDAGHLTIVRSLEDPNDVIREVLEALDSVVSRRGVTLRGQTSPELPRTQLDRDRVRQVLANLVGNASKIGASEISVGAAVDSTNLVFSVQDNGPGIPAEDLPRMFDRFWRGRDTAYRGSGLGLSISNEIVKAHGGRLWIESTPGAGSTFFLSIPR
ncbi:MAG: ATP-binding protein [Vicinamibacterales bacterium]